MLPRTDDPEAEQEILSLQRVWRYHGRVDGTQGDGLRMQEALQMQLYMRRRDTWLQYQDTLDFMEIVHGLTARKQTALLKFIRRAAYFAPKFPASQTALPLCFDRINCLLI